jgi:hypothetical protein
MRRVETAQQAARRRERRRANYAAQTTEQLEAVRAKVREYARARSAAWTPEERAEFNAKHKAWRGTDAAKRARRIQDRKRRGVANPTDELRDGPCAICGTDTALVLDHDHDTGATRGWI